MAAVSRPRVPQVKHHWTMPLHWVLVVPFVVLISGSVGLVGYLSYRSGEQAVQDLVHQLQNEKSLRIVQHLDNYLSIPQKINQTNLEAIELGILDLQNFETTGKYFWRQLHIFHVGYINYGNEAGEFIGAGYEEGKLRISEKKHNQPYQIFAANPQGDRLSVVQTKPEGNPNAADWYTDALKAGQPIWSQIYNWQDDPSVMAISASYPVYNSRQQVIGVIGVDLILSQISKFLQTIQVTASGRTFILEQNGLLVASSSNEAPFRMVNGEARRLAANDSQDPVVNFVTRKLEQQFGSWRNLDQQTQLNTTFEGERYFIQVTPWRDPLGLDWLVVVVVPETEFMGQIQANTRTTILLCALTLGLALLLGLLTARWVATPIAQLSQASYAMAAGAKQQPLPTQTAITELQTLAEAFELMSAQVYQSLDRVKIALQESKEKYQTLFQTLPMGIAITDAKGKLLESNPASERILGIPIDVQTQRTHDAPDWQIIRPDGSPMPPTEFASVRALQENRYVANVEMGVVQPDGQIRWISVSATPIPLEHYGVAIAYIDITERKQQEAERKTAELALKEKTAELDYFFSAALDLLCIANTDGYFLRLNPQWQVCLGYSLSDLEGKRFLDFVHPEDLQATLAAIGQLSQQQPILNFTNRYRHQDGSYRWIEWRSVPQGDLIYSAARDITERKQTEAQIQAALAEKVTLLQEVHHRVKNNLQVICSLLRLQKNRIKDAQISSVLEDSNNRILSMALVHQSLYESQNFAQVNLADYVQALLQSLLQSYGGRSGQVNTQIQIPATAFVRLDQAVPCGLILNELITNAFKHGFADPDRSGQIQITLTIEESETIEERGSYVLRVANNGKPLPPGFSLEQSRRSLGMQLMLVLTEQLQGRLVLEQHADRAGDLTIFALHFGPNPAKYN
uniref:histidine kinase n=1 Tax=Cyanothece sp. (strain PCC 7425 / ATCC 29141) TaxID=395961 RepID=B8HWM5_CYAP4